MKAGTCDFKLLDSHGVVPLSGANLAIASVQDGKQIAAVASDKQGECTLDIDGGRYILRVDQRNLCILETAESHDVTLCRILVPEQELQVGGQQFPPPEEDDDTGETLILGMKPIYAAGAALLTAGIVWGAIEVIDDDDDDETAEERAARLAREAEAAAARLAAERAAAAAALGGQDDDDAPPPPASP